MTNLDFAKEWPFTVTEQTMTDGWTWYRVEGVQDMTLTQLAEVYNTPRGGFELVTVYESEEADAIPESFVNMLEEVTSNGRVIGLFPEPKPEPEKPLKPWVLTRTTWESVIVQARDYDHAKELCEFADFDSANGDCEFNAEPE